MRSAIGHPLLPVTTRFSFRKRVAPVLETPCCSCRIPGSHCPPNPACRPGNPGHCDIRATTSFTSKALSTGLPSTSDWNMENTSLFTLRLISHQRSRRMQNAWINLPSGPRLQTISARMKTRFRCRLCSSPPGTDEPDLFVVPGSSPMNVCGKMLSFWLYCGGK